jgi:hypothetical protein
VTHHRRQTQQGEVAAIMRTITDRSMGFARQTADSLLFMNEDFRVL